jgi:hypothetical protein
MSNLLRPILILLVAGLALVACSGDDQGSTLPAGCEGTTWGSGIQVEERDGQYIAIIQGDMPDACSEVCGYEQTSSGNTINIDVYSSNPEDQMCAQVLTPFNAEVQLDIDGLEAGQYTLTLNETHAETTFTME